MADENTDAASMEELSICGRWFFKGEPVGTFFGIVHAKEINVKTITRHLLQLLNERSLSLEKLRGFDGVRSG